MRIVERHPLWLRLLHWLSIPILVVMIWSGNLIYWANHVYEPFYPEWFFKKLGLEHKLAQGMGLHFTYAWLLVLFGAVFIVLTATSGHWKELLPRKRELKEIGLTLRNELLHWRPPAAMKGGYNVLQKTAYSGFIALTLIEVLSGFAIYKPVQLRWIEAVFGGYESARVVHFVGMLLISAFVLVHIIQVARAGWNNFRSIVAGFEVRDD